MAREVIVIGGGLAGCEAAWQLARRGVSVRLCEMRPARFSDAHSTPDLAELVCSNSLRSDRIDNAIGLLHEEMRRLGSLVMEAADAHRVPAGSALAVDRIRFARELTGRVEGESRIEIVRGEVSDLPPGLVVVATGPLTSATLAARIGDLCGDSLYFYDSISPTVYLDSLDLDSMYRASRWEDGEGDYLNIPLSREQYGAFVEALLEAETVPIREFEKEIYFEGCLPIEVMAARGRDTLAFGPMKPVGLRDPRTGETGFATVQLRQEDKTGTLWGLVGFQTKMRVADQRRVLRSLPGMHDAVFARYGSVHRNTFICAPRLLDERLQHRQREGLYFAGQIAGVEGYVESAALGLLAGIFVAHAASGEEAPLPPRTTALGALLAHLHDAPANAFQPMNVNYGLFPAPGTGTGTGRRSRRQRHREMSERALRDLADYAARVEPGTR